MDKDNLAYGDLPSTTHKVSVNWYNPKAGAYVDVNAYVHLIWSPESLRLVGIKVDGLPQFAHAIKALLQEYCLELSERLVRGEIDLTYICQRWIAQRFAPDGYCPELEGRPVKSILDAAAKLFMQRYNINWE